MDNSILREVRQSKVPLQKPPVSDGQRRFRDALSRRASTVNIVTTDGAAGRAGFTATAVCAVTDAPPTLLVCINRHSSVYDVVKQNQVLCVSSLSIKQRELSNVFGGKTPMTERFAHGTWHIMPSGALALDGAVATFDCKISTIHRAGSHDVFFCEVLNFAVNEGETSLLYGNRDYHQLQPLT